VNASNDAYSLLRRLTVAFTIVASVVLSLAGGLLYHSLSLQLRQRDDSEISVKLNEFLREARSFGSAQAVARNGTLFQEELLTHPAITFAILDARGNVLADSGRPHQHFTSVGSSDPAASQPYSCNPPTVGPSRCVFGDETLPSSETIRVLLAHEATERYAVLGAYRGDVWMVLLGGSVLMGLLGYVIAKRGLTPVKSIGQHISRIEAHNLGARLDMGGGPVELRDIAVPVNRMLDRLERAFARLSQFSSDLAHDMRTPLANIISSSQVTLSRERTAEEYETLIDSNIEECERLQRMIETMLFLARVDHAAEPLKRGELDCAIEFARLTSYFEAIADNKGIRFVVDGAVQVRADPTMFRRAVSNLISNALEYADPESDIVLRAYRAGDRTAVSVTNSGQTIPHEHIGKIFDRFYRVNAARQGSAKNMGLGLAIVKSIMELHRGNVDVESSAGVTIFTLYFPSAVVEPPRKSHHAASIEQRTATSL
jgi:two-component system, OmpR family, heavy metal sensor histidine kinase CusS